MIERATVDAYDESEQATGWLAVLEDNLDLPFETNLLGARVTVVRIDLRGGNQISALCRRGTEQLWIGLVELPLPAPKPGGADWINAYRIWLQGRW